MNTNTWQQNTTAATDSWRCDIDFGVYALITQYEYSHNDYCWQAVRGEFRVSGIIAGQASAMAMADSTMALPVEEFNAIVAANLRADLKDIEKKLLILQPDTTLLPGFHSGYEAGAEDMKRKIAAVLS